MRKDWKIKSLVELEEEGIILLGRGMVINKKDLAKTPGDYPVYSSAQLDDGVFGRYGKYMFDEELITWSVDGGGTLFYRTKHKFSITNVGGFCRILRPDLISYKYLYFILSYLHSTIKFDWVKKAHPSTLRKEYKTIPLPTLEEQHRFVSAVDKSFASINIAKVNTEKILKNTKELFESFLFSIFENKSGGWEEKTLKEVSQDFGRGKSKHRPRGDKSLLGGKYPLIQTGEISNADHWIDNYTQTYNEKGLAQSKLWPKGTICIAIVGANVAETAILNFDACFPDSVIGIIVDSKKANAEYVDYLLQTFKTILKEKGKGTARDNINLGTFENQKFPFPSVSAQKIIVQKLDALSAETKKLEAIYQQKLNDLEELKKSVLQKAFSGELINNN